MQYFKQTNETIQNNMLNSKFLFKNCCNDFLCKTFKIHWTVFRQPSNCPLLQTMFPQTGWPTTLLQTSFEILKNRQKTYPINQSIVSRRYSGILSSLAVFLESLCWSLLGTQGTPTLFHLKQCVKMATSVLMRTVNAPREYALELSDRKKNQWTTKLK